MFEVLDAFDDIVSNAANVYRLQDRPLHLGVCLL